MTSEAPVAIPCVDWNTISEEILCPLCDYNLRGLIQPRCPECGSQYQWDDLLDPKRRKHPYLFEHHPEMNWTSFWRTARGGLRPIEFWRSLHPVQPSIGRRLLLYASIILIGLFLLLTIGTFVCCVSGYYYQLMYWSGATTPDRLSTLDGAVQRTIPTFLTTKVLLYRLPTYLIIGWPILTLVTLMIFKDSMQRAKVKTIHVVRCVVYSADVLIWFGLAMVLLRANQLLLTLSPVVFYAMASTLALIRVLSFLLPRNSRRDGVLGPILLSADLLLLTAIVASGLSYSDAWFNSPGFLVIYEETSTPLVLAFLLLGTVKLIAAYKIYLQFDRPIATILASQAIVFLGALNTYLYVVLY